MRQGKAVDGFRLTDERTGLGPGMPAVLLLHGWPGDRTDYRLVAPLLSEVADVIELCTQLIDGQPDAVRAYLRHFWSHWSEHAR